MTALATHAERMIPDVERELARARRRLLEVRAEMRAAEDNVARLRALHRSLHMTITGQPPEEDDSDEGLVGWRVGEAALSVLEVAGEPLHYREVWERMQARGDRIVSEGPEAVVLTALTRHPDIRRVSRGVYASPEAQEVAE